MLIRETLRRRRESPDSSVSERIEAKSTLEDVREEEVGGDDETGRAICFEDCFGVEGRRDERITLGFVVRICPEEEKRV